MSKTLLEQTQDLISETREMVNAEKNGGLSRDVIASESGVNQWWLMKFAQGSIRNPNIEKVAKLHDFLSKRTNAA